MTRWTVQMNKCTNTHTHTHTHAHTHSLAHCPKQFLLNLGYPGPPAHHDDALYLILPGQEEGYMTHLWHTSDMTHLWHDTPLTHLWHTSDTPLSWHTSYASLSRWQALQMQNYANYHIQNVLNLVMIFITVWEYELCESIYIHGFMGDMVQGSGTTTPCAHFRAWGCTKTALHSTTGSHPSISSNLSFPSCPPATSQRLCLNHNRPN